MKKLFSLITITLALPCIAMESETNQKPQQPIVLRKINGVKNPCCGHFLPTGKVIISDGDGCSIYDTKTGDELKTIDNVPLRHVALHPNRKLCALSGGNSGIETYDIETSTFKKIGCNPTIIASVFEPLYDVIEILYGNCDAITRSYHTTQRESRGRGHGHTRGSPAIAFHPTEPIMCVAQNMGKILFFDITAGAFNEYLNIPINLKGFNFTPKAYRFCQFNRDGSLLICGDKHQFYVGNKDDIVLHRSFVPEETLQDVIFHLNGVILITLLQPGNRIFFWDVSGTSQRNSPSIVTIACSSSEDNPPTEHRHMHSYLSCNRSGKDLLVVLSKECLVVPVPFEAIYNGIKEEYILSYFVLQRYLPKDVLHMFIAKLLKIRKRRLEKPRIIKKG